LEATFTPIYNFFMLGLGYGHPKWGHGLNHGELAVEREDIVLSDVDVRQQHHLHVQALCDVTCPMRMAACSGPRRAEQLALGPHAPSGFKLRWIWRHESFGAGELGQLLERYLPTLGR
jgi:hypothetical protein